MKLKTKLSLYQSLKRKGTLLLLLLFSFYSYQAQSKNWLQVKASAISRNYSLARSKSIDLVFKKYSIPAEFKAAFFQSLSLSLLAEKYLSECSKKEKRVFGCEVKKEQIKSSVDSIKYSLKNILSKKWEAKSNEYLKAHVHLIAWYNFLYDIDIHTQKSLVSLVTVNTNRCLSFIDIYIPSKSKSFVSDIIDFSFNLKSEISKFPEKKILMMNKSLTHFVKEQKEEEGHKGRYARDLDLITTYWNNVLKIKKDR
ncbi:MAG: hypothetical protein CME61_03590 [Halobacteriovoraceae bacterium]|nr:hypothetical protein [Halobacteriovoraceae bacterium]